VADGSSTKKYPLLERKKGPSAPKNRFYGGHEGVSRKKSGKYENSRRPTKKKGVIVEI